MSLEVIYNIPLLSEWMVELGASFVGRPASVVQPCARHTGCSRNAFLISRKANFEKKKTHIVSRYWMITLLKYVIWVNTDLVAPNGKLTERWVCWEAVVAYFKLLSQYLPEADIRILDPRAWNRTRNLEYETRVFLMSQNFWWLLVARRTFELLCRDGCMYIPYILESNPH